MSTDPYTLTFGLIKRWWWLAVVLGLVSGFVAYRATRVLIKSQYGATVTLEVPLNRVGGMSNAVVLASSDAMRITSGPVLAVAHASLSPEAKRDPRALDRIICSTTAATVMFSCGTTSHNPVAAAAVLNDLARVFVRIDRQQQNQLLLPQLKQVTGQERQTRRRLTSLQNQLNQALANVQHVQVAQGQSGAPDLTDQYRLTAIQGQLAQDQAILTQLNFAEQTLHGKSLTIVQGQKRHLDQEVANLQQELNSTVARLQAHARSQAAAGQGADILDQGRVSSLQGLINQKQSALDQLTAQESTLRQQMASNASTITDPAVPNYSQISPRPLLNAALGLIIGLGIAMALAILMEFRNRRFRTIEEVSTTTGLNVLGVLSRVRSAPVDLHLLAATQPYAPTTEAVRLASTNIQLAGLNGSRTTLLVTSAKEGEGKSTVAANLAVQMALAGQRILLIDGDLRVGGLSRKFGLEASEGLSSALQQPHVDLLPTESSIPNLHIVPAGAAPPNSVELLGSSRMREWFEEMKVRYDAIIVDSPPIVAVADARILARLSDAVVLVVDSRIADRPAVLQACSSIQATRTSILGVILNKNVHKGMSSYQPYPQQAISSLPPDASTPPAVAGW